MVSSPTLGAETASESAAEDGESKRACLIAHAAGAPGRERALRRIVLTGALALCVCAAMGARWTCTELRPRENRNDHVAIMGWRPRH